MSTPTYFAWTSGMNKQNIPAEVAWNEIESIREANGGLVTAEAVVESSRSENAVLHKIFEWDDSIAGKLHREHQARTLIGSIQVSFAKTNVATTRAFEITVRDGNKGYSPVDIILSNVDERDALLRRALAELASFQKRYAGLSELSAVLADIDLLVTRQGAVG